MKSGAPPRSGIPVPVKSRPGFSLPVKILLIYAACALVLVFATFVAGSYYVNRLQKGNVRAAVELAREHARQMSRDILEMATSQNVSDLDQPAVKASLKTLTEITVRMNKNVVWAAVVDPSGNRTIEQSGRAEQVFKVQSPSGKPVISRVPGPAGGELEIETRNVGEGIQEITQPIRGEGRDLGMIRMQIRENPTFARIEASSRTITEALVTGCIFLFVFLLVVFGILWRLFARQIELVQRNARLDRMAYVGTLASGLAHEIRNPLSSMNVNLEVLREEMGEPEVAASPASARAAELATRVQREVQQLNSTLTTFLEFALPTKEGLSEFSLRGLMEELIELHSEQMRVAGIQFDFQAPSHEDSRLHADRRLLHQALRNVLVNAIQVLHGSVKKQIRIRLESTGSDQLRLLISDTGPGIPAENLGKIFEVFFSTRKGGSGFGLAIARKIVEEHGGTIRAENNPESLGATFIIELPTRPGRQPNIFRRPWAAQRALDAVDTTAIQTGQ